MRLNRLGEHPQETSTQDHILLCSTDLCSGHTPPPPLSQALVVSGPLGEAGTLLLLSSAGCVRMQHRPMRLPHDAGTRRHAGPPRLPQVHLRIHTATVYNSRRLSRRRVRPGGPGPDASGVPGPASPSWQASFTTTNPLAQNSWPDPLRKQTGPCFHARPSLLVCQNRANRLDVAFPKRHPLVPHCSPRSQSKSSTPWSHHQRRQATQGVLADIDWIHSAVKASHQHAIVLWYAVYEWQMCSDASMRRCNDTLVHHTHTHPVSVRVALVCGLPYSRLDDLRIQD